MIVMRMVPWYRGVVLVGIIMNHYQLRNADDEDHDDCGRPVAYHSTNSSGSHDPLLPQSTPPPLPPSQFPSLFLFTDHYVARLVE